MGHRKDTCEKKRLGVPSLDYEAHEIRDGYDSNKQSLCVVNE
jgi:hypothetical protein